MTIPAAGPFVLLEDARTGAASARLFTRPERIVVARHDGEVLEALEEVRRALGEGLHAAGWLSYEAGRAMEPRLQLQPPRGQSHATPLVWFGLFERVERVAAADVAALLPDGAGAWISAARPRIADADYAHAFKRAHDYIVAGDIYQVNLSFRADVTLLGDPAAAYARLRQSGGGGWSALVHDGADWLLSTSPELFFKLASDGRIEARPMKGTARRQSDPVADGEAAAALQRDPKERAENVMIVDLLRNDISKLAARGSVHVPELFAVETYPTLHTLTSTVRAKLRPEHDAIDVLKALFPCGSITGAPKIRAMEIIRELEPDERGAYTGAIGWMSPDGGAEFNVAIRTLSVRGGRAELGVGSAVVYDSTAAKEWEECRIKSRFLVQASPSFELIETMRFEPGSGVVRLEGHLARVRRAAETLAFAFDEAHVRDALAKAAHTEACVLRLTVNADGGVSVRRLPMPAFNAEPKVAVAPLPVASSDYRLRFKTTLRDFYDHARKASGCDEVVFVGADGFVTEGSISNIFVMRDGVLLTPPAHRGLLPGVLRAELLQEGRAVEADLRVEDLGEGFYIGNSVRGLVHARLADAADLRRAAVG
ncbi:MAG: aminodeoxychorismate synthase component I [Hyphomonadaceae bacterium]